MDTENGTGPTDQASTAAGVGDPTGDLLRRYRSGEHLSPQEFGHLGAHYAQIGKPLPKDERKAALRSQPRPGPGLAEGVLSDMQIDSGGEGQGVGAPPVDPTIGARMLSDTIRVLLGTLEKASARRIDKVAKDLGGDDDARKALAEHAKLNPQAVDLVADTAPVLAAKYGMGSEYSPELAMATGVGMLFMDFSELYRKLGELEERILDREFAKGEMRNPPLGQ